jgi:hypothetical protein
VREDRAIVDGEEVCSVFSGICPDYHQGIASWGLRIADYDGQKQLVEK